jgi:hypothetical protein
VSVLGGLKKSANGVVMGLVQSPARWLRNSGYTAPMRRYRETGHG